jgi:hypothetical protein
MFAHGGARAATTPDPGDYVAAPAGVTLGVLYAQRITADKVYSGGSKVVDNLDLSLNVGIARMVHYINIGGVAADLQLIQPFGKQRVGLSGYSESGIGNTIFGGTVWSLADQTTGENLAWSAFVTVPTGGHQNTGFFLSEDRYALDLEAGYVRKLSKDFSLDVLGQTEIYTKDKTTQVERRPLWRAFAHLSYHLSPTTRLALSYRHSWGAREMLAGLTTTEALNNGNAMLTWSTFLTPRFNLQLQYARDVQVKNGPATSGLQSRFVYVF